MLGGHVGGFELVCALRLVDKNKVSCESKIPDGEVLVLEAEALGEVLFASLGFSSNPEMLMFWPFC